MAKCKHKWKRLSSGDVVVDWCKCGAVKYEKWVIRRRRDGKQKAVREWFYRYPKRGNRQPIKDLSDTIEFYDDWKY